MQHTHNVPIPQQAHFNWDFVRKNSCRHRDSNPRPSRPESNYINWSQSGIFVIKEEVEKNRTKIKVRFCFNFFYFASIRSETENLRPRDDSTDTCKLVSYKWMWLTMKLTLLLTVVKPDVKQTISTRLIKTKLNHLLYDLMSCKKTLSMILQVWRDLSDRPQVTFSCQIHECGFVILLLFHFQSNCSCNWQFKH